jgi:hypothetical protein
VISNKSQIVLASIAVLIVGTALIWGFLIVGSPSSARLQKCDNRRVDDLRAIHGAIQRMVIEQMEGKVRLKRSLPKSLEEVASYVRSEQNQMELSLLDPSTSELYVYRVKSETKYELCGTFALPRDLEGDVFWNHPAGMHCFEFDAVADEIKRLSDPGAHRR